MDPYSIKFIVLLILLIFSAFFSSSETAIFSFNKIRLRHLVEKGNKKAKLISNILEQPDSFITTILTGNNIVNIMASALSVDIALRIYGDKGLQIATFFITVTILLFSEILPKTIAAKKPEFVSMLFIYPIIGISYILYPIVKILSFITKIISKILGINSERKEIFTIEEFKTMVDVGNKEGVFQNQESEMINRIIKFKNKQVREILKTPRTDIIAIPVNTTYKEVKSIIVDQEFSRYPVYKKNLDEIVGILYWKDLFRISEEEKQNFDITKVMKQDNDLLFVPETKNVQELFTEMNEKKVHMAMIVDEYGGNAGLITLEDIVEVIVGDIKDETDENEKNYIYEQTEESMTINPAMPIVYFNEKFDTKIPNGDIETISGFILKQTGRFPEEKEIIEWADFKFTILETEKNKITIVKIEKIEE